MTNLDTQTLLLIILGVVALALLGQTLLLFAIFFAVRKTTRVVQENVESIREAALPILHNARELFVRVAPRIEDTANDLAAMAHGLREQTSDIQSSASDILDKLRHQCSRLDGMISSVFDAVDRASHFVTETVARPVHQLSGILSTAKSIVDSLRSQSAKVRPEASSPAAVPGVDADKDMFV